MVFRKSATVKKSDPLALPTKGGGKGVLPTRISIAQLSRNEADRKWVASVLDGDRTDLRFDDPNPTFGKPMGGAVIGLVAKGAARKAYNDTKRKDAWRHFTSPVQLKKVGREVEAQIRPNPSLEGVQALTGVDGDVANAATANVQGWAVGTTAMGT
jgi:hypothetical protein